jgi:hypothetical protein
MRNNKEKRKYIYAMIFGYSLALIAQIVAFKDEIPGKVRMIHDDKLFSLGNLGLFIAIGCFLVMAFREKTTLLRVIYILAIGPFVFNISLLDFLNKPYFNLIEIAGTSILLILMVFYLVRKPENGVESS